MASRGKGFTGCLVLDKKAGLVVTTVVEVLWREFDIKPIIVSSCLTYKLHVIWPKYRVS